MTKTKEARFAKLGFAPIRILDDGRVLGIHDMITTVGLHVDIDGDGNYAYRYCYERRVDAEKALAEWDGDGDPSGPWIKVKGHAIEERLGPGVNLGAITKGHFDRDEIDTAIRAIMDWDEYTSVGEGSRQLYLGGIRDCLKFTVSSIEQMKEKYK